MGFLEKIKMKRVDGKPSMILSKENLAGNWKKKTAKWPRRDSQCSYVVFLSPTYVPVAWFQNRLKATGGVNDQQL